MTFNPGDRVRLTRSTGYPECGETATVRNVLSPDRITVEFTWGELMILPPSRFEPVGDWPRPVNDSTSDDSEI